MVKLHDNFKKLLQIYKFSSNIIGTPPLLSRFVPSYQNRHEIRFKVSKSQKYQVQVLLVIILYFHIVLIMYFYRDA